jgi:hypothetical protein
MIRKIHIKACITDVKNVLTYGIYAPRFGERLFADPFDINVRITSRDLPGYTKSAKVVVDSWPHEKHTPIIGREYKSAALFRRWEQGFTWEKSGYIHFMMQRIEAGNNEYGLRNYDDVLARCDMLDAIFNEIKKEGRMKTQKELKKKSFREIGGVMVSISDRGELVKTNGGNHRHIIARILGLKKIPVVIGNVHINGFDKLKQIRNIDQPNKRHML